MPEIRMQHGNNGSFKKTKIIREFQYRKRRKFGFVVSKINASRKCFVSSDILCT
jgi:hypothetical protein